MQLPAEDVPFHYIWLISWIESSISCPLKYEWIYRDVNLQRSREHGVQNLLKARGSQSRPSQSDENVSTTFIPHDAARQMQQMRLYTAVGG